MQDIFAKNAKHPTGTFRWGYTNVANTNAKPLSILNGLFLTTDIIMIRRKQNIHKKNAGNKKIPAKKIPAKKIPAKKMKRDGQRLD